MTKEQIKNRMDEITKEAYTLQNGIQKDALQKEYKLLKRQLKELKLSK
ncbi:MAG: hypothetical protein P4L31_07445 [Candidatus Babeliales bacterium]|nr:hypothetical protein [Candidatus Babeliales bacterium]